MNVLLIVTAVLYAVLAVFVWRFWRSRAAEPYPLNRERLMLWPTWLLHTVTVWQPMLHDKVLLVGFGHALNLVSWLTVTLYLAGSYRYVLKGLQLLLFPLLTATVLLAVLLPGQPVAYPMQNEAFMLHVSSALLAYGLFGITTLLAMLMLILDYHLHRRKMSPMLTALPPLLSIEKLMFQGLKAGFVLLTVAVVTGTVFAEAVFGEPAQFTHKTVFGMISWLIYAVILFKHHTLAWRGKRAAWWVIVAFISLMLAYIGSKFVLEIILHRAV